MVDGVAVLLCDVSVVRWNESLLLLADAVITV